MMRVTSNCVIRPGIQLLVPAGADQARARPYALEVTAVKPIPAKPGFAAVDGRPLRIRDGQPHARDPIWAVLNIEQIERIEWCRSCRHRLDPAGDGTWHCPRCD